MNSLFYNIVSILVGISIFLFGIFKHKEQKPFVIALILIHAIGFIGFGIGGFFIVEKYEFITILGMLALAITLAIALLTLYDKDKDPKKPAKKQRPGARK